MTGYVPGEDRCCVTTGACQEHVVLVHGYLSTVAPAVVTPLDGDWQAVASAYRDRYGTPAQRVVQLVPSGR